MVFCSFGLCLVFLLLVLSWDRTIFFYVLGLESYSNFLVDLPIWCCKLVWLDQWLCSEHASVALFWTCFCLQPLGEQCCVGQLPQLLPCREPSPSHRCSLHGQGSCSTTWTASQLPLGAASSQLASQGGRRSIFTSNQCKTFIPQLNAHH